VQPFTTFIFRSLVLAADAGKMLRKFSPKGKCLYPRIKVRGLTHFYDKNMGLIFSFWDLMLGTLYIPTEKEELRFGISEENPNPHKTIKDALLLKQ